MSTVSIQTPFPIFHDIDGDKLSNGYVYIGVHGLDAETNPKNCYWDENLTSLITQPVRTLGGYPNNGGVRGRIYTDGDYSITIKNKNGTQIHSALSQTQFGSVKIIDTMSDLVAYGAGRYDGEQISLTSYHSGLNGGGGVFKWDSTQDKANHNGGTIIDPDITFPTDWSNTTQQTTWFAAGTGTGCWIRKDDGYIDIKSFGIKGDGVTDDTIPFSILSGIIGKYTGHEDNSILITDSISINSNVILTNLGRIFFSSITTGLLFDFSNSVNSKLLHSSVDASGTSISDNMILLNNSTNCLIQDNEFLSPTAGSLGSIAITGTASKNRILSNKCNNSSGTFCGVGGTSSSNTISDNKLSGNTGFGVKLTESSNNNIVTKNISDFGGIELVGVTYGSYRNVISNNIAIGTNDNGYSLSGYENVCTGNIAKNCAKAGIWSWGERNTIVGNTVLNNNTDNTGWAGIGVSANYGGTGQENTVCGNVIANSSSSSGHFNSVRISGSTYNVWTPSTSVTKVAQGTYVYYGLNIYILVTDGTNTTGTTPPTHTSGTVSDGGVEWRYVNTFYDNVNSTKNVVFANTSNRPQDEDYQDVSGGFNSILNEKSSPNGFLQTGVCKLGSFDSIVTFYVNKIAELRLEASALRPETDLGLSLGLVNRRYANTYSNRYYIGDGTTFLGSGSGSPEGVVTALVGSLYTRTDGGAGTTLYVKESGTGNTGWVAK